MGLSFASRFRFAAAGQRGRFSFWACVLRVVFVSPSRGGGRDRPAQPGTRRAVGAETARLRRAERPAERGRLRRGCLGMAAAKAGAGSCDADASEWQQPKRMPGVACVCCTLSRLSDACACRCRVECATCFRYILTNFSDEKSYMSRPSHHQPCVQAFSSRSVHSKSSRVPCHARCVASVMDRRINRKRQTCSWSGI